jgi:hypothetical protein
VGLLAPPLGTRNAAFVPHVLAAATPLQSWKQDCRDSSNNKTTGHKDTDGLVLLIVVRWANKMNFRSTNSNSFYVAARDANLHFIETWRVGWRDQAGLSQDRFLVFDLVIRGVKLVSIVPEETFTGRVLVILAYLESSKRIA